MAKGLPAGTLKKTIAYYYLLSYCPPEMIADFKKNTATLRQKLAKQAGMKVGDYFKQAVPEVCWRVVSFHETTREPNPEFVEPLTKAARQAEKNPEKAAAFQAEMSKVARLQSRALPENRLHRKKGCDYCRLPCHYGYFSLVSDPDFRELQRLMGVEAARPSGEQSPLRPVWAFTFTHLGKVLEAESGFIHRTHAGNLAFCLLMLSMAKSRLPLPEEQIQIFQAANQALIQPD
jgi:hypothetical protein